jgi:hypothetical protein
LSLDKRSLALTTDAIGLIQDDGNAVLLADID